MTDTNRVPLVAPFAGERFSAESRLNALIAPPYDVISDERRAELAARDAHNIVHLILPAGDGDRYRMVADLLRQWREDGTLVRDASPSVYVVQQEFETPDGERHVRTGVIAGLHVEPYAGGRVKPHERTHRGPKEDRLALSRATGAMLESIFVMAPDARGHLQRRLDGVTKHAPTATAALDGVGVALWCVGGAQGAEIARAAGEQSLYIADGHHRYETANAYREENPAAVRIPALIVPIADPGLIVLPTHRLITGALGDRAALVDRWREAFTVVDLGDDDDRLAPLRAEAGRGPACVVAFPDGAAHLLRLQEDGGAEPEIALVERDVIGPLRDAATSGTGVTYGADGAEVLATVRRGDATAAVLVNPTPVERVLAVSDAGGVMPPKSTYFAPKVPSGLVFIAYDA